MIKMNTFKTNAENFSLLEGENRISIACSVWKILIFKEMQFFSQAEMHYEKTVMSSRHINLAKH